MLRFTAMSSEHKEVPNRLLLSSEATNRNRRDYWSYRDDKINPYSEYSFSVYCTYAWIETDEIDVASLNDPTTIKDNQIPIAVMDYKPSYSKRTQFVFEEPIWNWMEERTPEVQRWIEHNIDRINDAFITYAHATGFLENVKG